MKLFVLKQAERELRKVPKDVRVDIQYCFEQLESGKKISMPISRPLSDIVRGLHELRISYKDGIYRVFYVIKLQDAIYILHFHKKKTQKIDKKTRELILSRIRSIP